ncbi:MAG: FAD-binding oxidoreductase [Elainellaceae cyanobacterium]
MGASPLSENTIISRVEKALGPGRISHWEELPQAQRGQLGGAVGLSEQAANSRQALGVVYPETQDELAETLALSQAENWSILPFGNGTKLAWGGLATSVQIGVSTSRLNRLIEHAVGDLTLTAEAGATVSALTLPLQEQRQCFGFNPAYPERATLGGVVATADTGWMRQRYGGIRDMLIGVSLVRADGQRAKAGGRVVKNVAGYDLMKLMTGSWGSLAVISEVTFRLYPQTEASKTLVVWGEADSLALLLSQVLKSGLMPTGLSLVNRRILSALGYGPGGAFLGLLVRFQSVAVGVETQAEMMAQTVDGLGLSMAIATDKTEQALWQQLGALRERDTGGESGESGDRVTAKVGLLPANAVATLVQLEAIADVTAAVTHVSSGLGWIGLNLRSAAQVGPIRDLYHRQGGFLSNLEAPSAWKSDLDIWGYSGNTMPLMRRIKQQFDPERRLSPGRFLL